MAPRSLESLGLGQGTSNVASSLVHIAYNPARWHIRAAPRFERTGTAVRKRCEIADRVIGADMAGAGQDFAGWTDINVPFLVKPEVLPREGAILTLLFVGMTGMWGSIFFSLTTQSSVSAEP